MRTRLLPLLIVLMAAVLLALGVPLAIGVASAQQQKVVVDRIDDTAHFAALAQFVTDASDERLETLESELASYYKVYGIRVGVFYDGDVPMATAPRGWFLPGRVRCATRSARRCSAAEARTPSRSGPGSGAGWSSPRR